MRSWHSFGKANRSSGAAEQKMPAHTIQTYICARMTAHSMPRLLNPVHYTFVYNITLVPVSCLRLSARVESLRIRARARPLVYVCVCVCHAIMQIVHTVDKRNQKIKRMFHIHMAHDYYVLVVSTFALTVSHSLAQSHTRVHTAKSMVPYTPGLSASLFPRQESIRTTIGTY